MARQDTDGCAMQMRPATPHEINVQRILKLIDDAPQTDREYAAYLLDCADSGQVAADRIETDYRKAEGAHRTARQVLAFIKALAGDSQGK